MKKTLISLVAVLCIICLGKQPVSAATYNEEQMSSHMGGFEAGDILQFDNKTEVIITNFDGQEIFRQTGNIVTLPTYPIEMKSFKGWVHTGTFINETTHTTTVLLKPYFKIEIIVNEVTDGDSIILSVPSDQIPFAPGTYTTEWIVGGMGGGYAVEEAPKNSLTWTIPATSNEYKNGAKFALRIVNVNSKKEFSEEAILVIKPKENKVPPKENEVPPKENEVPETTVNPEQPKKKVVATADGQSIFVNALFMVVAIAMITITKKRIQ